MGYRIIYGLLLLAVVGYIFAEDSCSELGFSAFQCGDGSCIRATYVCNGRNECGDNSDENDATCAYCNGVPGATKCSGSNRCFDERDRCDGFNDCIIFDANGKVSTEDKTDEENCSN